MVHSILTRLSLSLFLVGALCLGIGRAQLPVTHAGLGTLACPGPSQIAPASSSGINSGSASAGTTGAVAAGSTVVLGVDFNLGSTTNASFNSPITDSAGNNYTVVQPTANAVNTNAALAYNINVVAMSVGTTFTSSNTASAQWLLRGAWISCSKGAFDGSTTLNQSTANLGVSLTASGLNASNDIAFGYTHPSVSGGAGTVSTGTNGIWTSLYNNSANDIAYQNATSNSVTYNPSWTNSSVSSSVLIAFLQSGCTQATALIARMDGSQNTNAVTTLVCNGVNHGWWGKLDTFYMGAINSVGNSLLNWIANSCNSTSNGTITFSANNGWTSNGTTGYYNTSCAPSTYSQLRQNSAVMGVCSTSTGTTLTTQGGAQDASFNFITLGNAGATMYQSTNETGNTTYSITSVQGSWIAVRTASNAVTLYHQGTSFGTGTSASSGVPNVNIYLLAYNSNGTAAGFATGQMVYYFFGSQFSSTDVTNFRTDVNNYLTTIGGPSTC